MDTSALPRAMFTIVSRSSTVTCAVPLQAPTHVAGIRVGVKAGVLVGVPVGVSVAVGVGELVGVTVGVLVGVGV